MRKIREVLRLHAAGRSQRLIAQSVGIGQSTVGDYLNRARLAGVEWPTERDDAMLASGGYPWTVIRLSRRDDYLAALEQASAGQDIQPLTMFVAEEMRVDWSRKNEGKNEQRAP